MHKVTLVSAYKCVIHLGSWHGCKIMHPHILATPQTSSHHVGFLQSVAMEIAI